MTDDKSKGLRMPSGYKPFAAKPLLPDDRVNVSAAFLRGLAAGWVDWYDVLNSDNPDGIREILLQARWSATLNPVGFGREDRE